MRTIEIHGQEHASAHDAITELNFSGDLAISVGGRFFSVERDEHERLQAAGIEPTTWHDHAASGRIISVPGKHGC